MFANDHLCQQEAEDNNYGSQKSDSESTDADFSIDENDEVRSDENDDDEPKRKKNRVVTKAYEVCHTTSFIINIFVFFSLTCRELL